MSNTDSVSYIYTLKGSKFFFEGIEFPGQRWDILRGRSYHRGVDECVFKVCISIEQLLVEKGSILDVVKEGEVHGVRGGDVFDGHSFQRHGCV